MRKNNHLIDTTPQYYLIKVSSGSEKALVSSLIPNKVELTKEELESTQINAPTTIEVCAKYVGVLKKIRKVLE